MKHHYLPQFYLKNWNNPEKKVHTYFYENKKLIVKAWSPRYTGFEHNLYARNNDSDHSIEESHFSPIDNEAAGVLRKLIEGKLYELTADEKQKWTQFIVSLMVRTPLLVNTSKKIVESYIKDSPGDVNIMKKYGEYYDFKHNAYIDLIAAASGHENQYKLNFLNAFSEIFLQYNWVVLDFSHLKLNLLTCDSPIRICDINKNQLVKRQNHNDFSDVYSDENLSYVFPLNPKKCFIAFSYAIKEKNLRSVLKFLNLALIQGAYKYVYSDNEASTNFISKYFKDNS